MNHHAYLLIGGDAVHGSLLSFLEKKEKAAVRGNPDFFDRKYRNLSIDDARELKAAHANKPAGADGRRFFVITMSGITVEAQNALLKLLEEPGEGAYFFLIVPSAHMLLPTIRSRLSMGDLLATTDQEIPLESAALAEEFLAARPDKRLEMIKRLVEDISKEKKTRQDAVDFLNAVQVSVYGKGVTAKNRQALEAIETARKYIHDRAPSVKMLLEYVALQIS